jgi:hypothetical protein
MCPFLVARDLYSVAFQQGLTLDPPVSHCKLAGFYKWRRPTCHITSLGVALHFFFSQHRLIYRPADSFLCLYPDTGAAQYAIVHTSQTQPGKTSHCTRSTDRHIQRGKTQDLLSRSRALPVHNGHDSMLCSSEYGWGVVSFGSMRVLQKVDSYLYLSGPGRRRNVTGIVTGDNRS